MPNWSNNSKRTSNDGAEHEAITLSLGAAYCAGVQAMSVWDNEYYEDECDGYGSEPEDAGERPEKPETQDSGSVANENKD